MSPPRLWARCIRGLEQVVATEISTRLNGRVAELGHRDVLFECDEPTRAVHLRSADDVYLLAATISGVGRTKAGLSQLGSRISDQLDATLKLRPFAELRSRRLPISVTASFLGRRNFTRFDIEDAVGAVLSRMIGAPYHSRRSGRPPLSSAEWRIHLAGGRGLLGLRIAPRPLHRRGYKTWTVPGTTHPPLAAAMVMLATPPPGSVVWDPACGAGTIPIEAAALDVGLRAFGSDSNPAAVRAATDNALAGGFPATFLSADLAQIPVRRGVVGCLVSNLPWGRQATWERPAGPDAFLSEFGRVVSTGGSAVVLTEELIHPRNGWDQIGAIPISLMGSHPMISMLRRV